MPSICPTAEQLSEFVSSDFADSEWELDQHVENCSSCQAQISALVESDELGLRAALSGGAAGSLDTNCLRAMEQIARLTPVVAKIEKKIVTTPRADQHPIQLGPYKPLAIIGQGGMGTVYKAEHQHLRRIVALKVLSAARLQSQPDLARFQREMQAAGALEHENIVRAFDAGEHDGRPYLAMEYLRGCDASQIALAAGPLSVADACEIVRQTALGLQHAHEARLIHRDVKPANLMVTEGGIVKVLDLGLARLASSAGSELTSTGVVMGTLDYLSPEQAANSHEVDSRTDNYSLGTTLFKLLTGELPFPEGSNVLERMVAVAQSLPIPVTQFRTDVQPELLAIVDRLLSKSPADRPATCAEIASLLAPFAVGHNLRSLVSDTRRTIGDTEQPIVNEISPAAQNPAPPEPAPTTSMISPPVPRRQWIWQVSAIAPGIVALALAGWLIASNMASQRANTPGSTPPAVPAPGAAPPTLVVFVCQVDGQGKIVGRKSLGASESLRTADRVQIEIHPRQAGPLTLLFIDSQGKVDVLTSEPAAARKTIVFPSEEPIQLDEATGLETFLVVEGGDAESLRKKAQQEIDHVIEGAGVRSSGDFKINQVQLDAFLSKWKSQMRSESRIVDHRPL